MTDPLVRIHEVTADMEKVGHRYDDPKEMVPVTKKMLDDWRFIIDDAYWDLIKIRAEKEKL